MSNSLPPGGIREYLVDLANDEEGLTLDYTQVQFSVPSLIDGLIIDFSSPTERNSQVVLSVEASDTSPEVSVLMHYNRVNLQVLFAVFSNSFERLPGPSQQLSDYLGLINERLGSTLAVEDIVDVAVPEDDEPVTVTLQAAASSLYAYGSNAVVVRPPDIG